MGKPTIWYEKNLAIVRRYYGKETLEQIRERVVKQLEKDASAEGRSVRMYPSVSAIIYAANRAGAITDDELTEAYKALRDDKARNNKRVYRSRNAPGHVTSEARTNVLGRDASICQYCGQESNHIDHLLPVTRGGTGDTWNLIVACVSCNSSKGSKDLGPTLVSAMQRLIQGGWKYRNELLLDQALKHLEKRARKDNARFSAPKALLEPLTRPHLWCPRCKCVSDSGTAKVGRLKSGKLTLICGSCDKAADLKPTVGFFEIGQKVEALDSRFCSLLR